MTTTIFFFFNDTATTEIYTLSLHDALPIWIAPRVSVGVREERCSALRGIGLAPANSLSHRGPKERKVRKGRAATNEYRDCGESNNALRKSTTPGPPCSCSTSDSGECDVTIS